ncbi:2604_t:CDS:2 [Diversispora eburnea]|uniref:2604_t:CDS:1 n=1 Tax=Diversispora eburnea TaxID=1213867 RepID=A0A9N9A5K2_9GLOM|nr:2604_t:CDS:2 [Diversispora eburnea]
MADQPRECVLQLEDYMECLHHKKEKARAQAIKNEELKQRKQRKEAAEVARKITESNAKSDVMRIGILMQTIKYL